MLFDCLMYDKRINTKVIDYIDGNLAGGNTYQWEGTQTFQDQDTYLQWVRLEE